MTVRKLLLLILLFGSICQLSPAQVQTIPGELLTIDRIFKSGEFQVKQPPEMQWINHGDAYVVSEPNPGKSAWVDLVKYETATHKRTVFLAADQLIPEGSEKPISIESFTLSPDESKVLIFTNSKRVWRSHTRGDYWVYDLTNHTLKKLGASFPSSSLMFAKFSEDNQYVAYVHNFNLYLENFTNGTTTQLTFDGNGKIINGTFDWVYEEEFGCRDGFRWNQSGTGIAFWQLDASKIGIFYLINNTDSIYSRVIPIQYPKVGQPPSACRVGIITPADQKITWIPVPGDERAYYIPRMQWLNNHMLLIQQINRKQDTLRFYTYDFPSRQLKVVYEETEPTWVDIDYPDATADAWEMDDLIQVDKGQSVLRMSESSGWRHLIKVNLTTGMITDLTPGNYDVARYYTATDRFVYFNASPGNSTQRYLYKVSLSGKGDTTRITPRNEPGMNTYEIAPNSRYAIHTLSSVNFPPVTDLITLPAHKELIGLVDNAELKNKMSLLQPTPTRFFTVTTTDGIKIDGRMTTPPGFSPAEKYPVLFYVYGEPWDQVATDSWGNIWEKMIAQKGYLVIAMDNRGTPCLKGSTWRKCIYRKIGVLNTHDQAMAAREVLKWNFVDSSRIAVWGWSGGGSMTLNLMFRYPSLYKTGMAVAAISNELTYDNVYTERYMGLPSENMEDYVAGSPVTYAGNLKGNLLVVHGTGDDNVHYQNLEMLANELIRQNKQFSMMAYPNRTHGIYEGENTTRHLFTLLTNFLLKNCPPGGRK